MTVFIRVVDLPVEEKRDELLRSVVAVRRGGAPTECKTVFDRAPEAFAAVPGSPFAYWASDRVLSTFATLPPFEAGIRSAKQGLATSNDPRFLRLWWELNDQSGWFPYAKGGAFSRFYSDSPLSVNWGADGEAIKAEVDGKYSHIEGYQTYWVVKNPSHYFRRGLTWPRRTQGGLGLRVMPAGCIFADKGPAAFIDGDSFESLLALLAIATSDAFRYLVELQMAFGSYEVGVIQRTPVPNLRESDSAMLSRLARRAWSLKRSLDMTGETSHAFLLPPGLNEKWTGLDAVAVKQELQVIQRQINDAAFALYRISAEDRVAIEASLGHGMSGEGNDDEEEDSTDDNAPTGAAADALNSWLVGVPFGRFDPRLATGERPIPPEPEPFDALPSRSPGMYPEGEEPADRPDMLVDDEGHADDLAARARAVAERVKVDVPENLRGWLAKEFFPLHIKMYSKSRRKAPIYWQLGTPSASYSVWLYSHAFSKDTLFRVQNDYVVQKLAHEERRLGSLTRELRDKAIPVQRKELATQEAFVDELRAFLEEVKRVAPLWNPSLDDGVIINFAPLWRLVPHHKPWQKELKATWDALCAGEYDWAHLAMHLWPERVVPRCATDRSLAIAHDLEDVFWVEGEDGKWKPRPKPTRPVDELVRERTSPAVKAALKSLLEAPAAPVGNGRGRPRRGRRTAGTPT